MATQIGVNAPNQIASNAKIVGYDKMLRSKALLQDIYTNLRGAFKVDTKAVPNAIMMDIDDAALSNSTEAKITMKLKLSGDGVYGNNFAIGTEERPQTRTVTIYRNNLRKVISTPGYGVRSLDAEGYKLYETHIDDLADWNREHEGLEIRQAVLERYGETLVYGDTASSCTRNWNKNIVVAGLPQRDASPAYSSSTSTYTTNIVNKLLDSGGGQLKTPLVSQTLNQPNLSMLSNIALAKRVPKLRLPGLPGGMGYVVTVSELQYNYLGDPAWSNRNLGGLFRDITAQDKEVQSWSGVIGSFKDMLFCLDERQPTIDITGTSAPHGLSGGYVWPGDDDQRNRDQDTVCDTVTLHGKASLISWYPEKLHHITQVDDYGAIVGHGTALVRGVQTPHYTDANGNNPEQYGSVVMLTRIPEYT